MNKLPFSLTIRGDSPYYYVRFRNEQTGKFMTWISTKEKNYNRALRKSWELYNEKSKNGELEKKSFYDVVRKSEYTQEDVKSFIEDFQKKGFLLSYVLNDGGILCENALQWLCDFWNPEKSVYIKEKQRKGQTIHRKHIENSEAFIRNHWEGILQNKRLGELCRKDIQKQFSRLDEMELNGNTKNHILRSVLTPLKWAYNNELLPKDLSKGWVMYKVEYEKRIILTMEMARSVFRVEWGSDMARLASMLAMCTGMRCGEILALTGDDLGEDFIHVRHSYNMKDGLKCTKNTEERIVYVPFGYVMERLRFYLAANPYENGAGYVFWGLLPDKPIDGKVFLKFFRRALVKAGMQKQDAEKITFHAWRHFYATYMAPRVNQRALQSQTGHKTKAMLEHYSNHQTLEEAEVIKIAQREVFGELVE